MFNTTSVLASLGGVLSGGNDTTALHATIQEIDTNLLRDDNIQVISSLQLNQIASYTFHESSIANGVDLSEQIIERMIGRILSKPLDHSVLTLQKTLVVLRHILIFGAEKNLHACLPLGRLIQESLLNYNTALIAAQQQQTGISVTGMLLRLKGGTVDKGGPVRDVAQQVHILLSNRDHLLYERVHQQDPTSLVPVGSNDTCAFVSDEVRYNALCLRIERERRVEIKSNLCKQDSAFGSGYAARDGKNVVGAAHGIEEMIKQAQREKMKFADNGKPIDNTTTVTASDFAEYMAPTEADLLPSTNYTNNNNGSFGGSSSSYHMQQQLVVVDDFLSLAPTIAATATDDLLGFGGGGDGGVLGDHQHLHPTVGNAATADLLLGETTSAASSTAALTAAAAVDDPYGTVLGSSITPSLMHISTTPTTTVMKPKNIMSSSLRSMNNSRTSGHNDPFAALDALGPPSSVSAMNKSNSSLGGTTGGLMSGLSSLSLNGGGSNSVAAAMSSQPLSTLSMNSNNPLTDLSSLSLLSITTPSSSSTMMPVVTILPPTVSATSMRVSQTIPGVNYNTNKNNDDDDDGGGFVMGGTVGSGLMPEGPAPACAPPPPPEAGSSLW